MPTSSRGTRRVLVLMASFLAWWTALPTARAEDSRRVSEPNVPPTCIALSARFSAPKGALTDADEDAPDTRRIQDGIDSCAAGKAVALQASGSKNVFLAGPL